MRRVSTMPAPSRHPWLAAALFAATAAMSAFAAPSTVNDGETPGAQSSPILTKPLTGADPADLSHGTDAPGSSRTIRMLLEMQATPDKPAAPASAAKNVTIKPKAAGVAVTPAAPTLADQPPQPGGDGESVEWLGGLATAGPGTISRGAAIGTDVTYGRPGYATDQPNGRTAAPESASRTFSLFPRQWIDFLRENRNWVLGGSVTLLAILGVGASISTQRRR